MAGVALGVGGFDYIAVGVVIVGDAFLLCVAFQPLIFVEKLGISLFLCCVAPCLARLCFLVSVNIDCDATH